MMDSKYNVEDNSSVNSDESTPSLQIVKETKQLIHAKS